MSARTRRSSTRKQVLPDPEESNNSKSCDVEPASEQTFSLEEKEREIWDEVRDENYDIIEQLPLTIHRLFTLIRQLDCQACDYTDSLLPKIHQYVQLRHQLDQNGTEPAQSTEVERSSLSLTGSPDVNTPTMTPTRHVSVMSDPVQANARSTRPSTREMLSHIGWESEEYLRTSREKVNIAQTVQDLIDRQIRLLDQFIKEQKASLGPEPNAPVMLSMSELVVPKWSRPTRASMSPMPDELEGQAPIRSEASQPPVRASKRRPSKGTKSKENEKEKEEPSVSPALKITLPPPNPDIGIDPNEPTWCYCNRVSFGEMIGCDDPECKYEWFHLECVGLNEVPEDDEWYCRECIQRREAKNRRR